MFEFKDVKKVFEFKDVKKGLPDQDPCKVLLFSYICSIINHEWFPTRVQQDAIISIINDMIDAAYLAGVNDTRQNFQNLVWESEAPVFTTKIESAVNKVTEYLDSQKKSPLIDDIKIKF